MTNPSDQSKVSPWSLVVSHLPGLPLILTPAGRFWRPECGPFEALIFGYTHPVFSFPDIANTFCCRSFLLFRLLQNVSMAFIWRESSFYNDYLLGDYSM